MLLKRLDDVGLSDIEMLRENKALESRFIDFKAEAIGGADKDKREFLADVSSFANAAGGDLILGVKTKDGAADEVCGINLADPDKEKQRLINMVRDGLEPRLAVVDIAWLPMSGTTGVMAIRVPRSWSAPHRVTFQKDMHFYVRNSAGKHPMNVDELRRAFGLSASIADRMRAFREERLSAFGSLPFGVRAGPKIAVLIAPVSAFVDPLDLDVRVERRPRDVVRPISNHSSTYQYCLEGVATVTPGSPVEAYSLMFRMGVVECVAPILSNDPTRATVSAYRIRGSRFQSVGRICRVRKGLRDRTSDVGLRDAARNRQHPDIDTFGGRGAVIRVRRADREAARGVRRPRRLRQAAGGAVQKDARRRCERVRPS